MHETGNLQLPIGFTLNILHSEKIRNLQLHSPALKLAIGEAGSVKPLQGFMISVYRKVSPCK
jgi:hypothetical protein